MLDFIFNVGFLATLSWFYHVILKDYLLSEWFSFGYDKFGRYEGTWKEYLYMPIWGCQYCTSGQLALWYYFFICNDYKLYLHIAFITFTVITTKIIWKHLES